MKEVATYTRMTPAQRRVEMTNFVRRVMENEGARALLDSWGLKLGRSPLQLQARMLQPETIFFGGNYK